MSAPRAKKASLVSASTTPTGARTTAPAATATTSSFSRHWRRSCASNLSIATPEEKRRVLWDRVFVLLLIPLAAVSLPSLAFCALELALWTHGVFAGGAIEFHLPPQTAWDSLYALQASTYHWVSRWNWLATLAATGLFVCTLARRRWRPWAGLALVPYGVLLCADFTLRWRFLLIP